MKTLETERLILRKWTVEDLDDFYEYAKTPNVGPSAGWKPHENKEESLKILEMFIAKENPLFAIVWKENNKAIGSIELFSDPKRTSIGSYELGYVLAEPYWWKGIMVEAGMAVLQYAFEELNQELVGIGHYPFNQKSKRVIEKLGFQYEGTLRRAHQLFDGSIQDLLCYSITKEEFER